MISSIGTIVTLSKNVLLLVLRYKSSYDPVRTFFIKMWVIPKVMPQIREEFLPLLKCKTWRRKLCNDKISIICKPRVEMRLYFYNNQVTFTIFRQVVCIVLISVGGWINASTPSRLR